MSLISLVQVNTPPLNNAMYYKREDYKFQDDGYKVIIPADAPSGWYEVRASINLNYTDGAGRAFWPGVLESVAYGSIKYKQEYAPWFAPIALPHGVGFEFGLAEPGELVQYCSLNDAIITGGDVGFRGYAKHVSGSDTYACRLTQLDNAPSNPDAILGSYIIRQVTQ